MQEELLIRDYLDENEDSMFLKYCKVNGYQYLGQISATDYVLFAIKYKLGRKKYIELEERIEGIISEAYLNSSMDLAKKTLAKKIIFDFNTPIETMNLSTRSRNGLINAQIDTIFKLYIKTEDELGSLRALGEKSLSEIIKRRKAFFPDPSILLEVIMGMGEDFKREVISIAKGEKVHQNQGDILLFVKGQIDLLGRELVDKAIYEPDYTSQLIESLKDYSTRTLSQNKLNMSYNRIPPNRLEKNIHSFIDLTYDIKEIDPITDDLRAIEKVKDLEKIFEKVGNNKKKINALYPLMEFISCDILLFLDAKLTVIFDNLDCPLKKEVLYRRYKGDTLQKISLDHKVTREWVRQTENNVKSLLENEFKQIGFDLYAFIALDLGVDVISREALFDYFGKGKEAEFICYLLVELYKNTSYIYDAKIDAILLKNKKSELEKAKEIINQLDKIIPKQKVLSIIEDRCRQYSFDCAIVEPLFYGRYVLHGNVYVRGTFNLQNIYDYILKEFYPSGLRVFDDDEIKAFKDRVQRIFGKVRFPKNERALSLMIVELGLLYDRGLYIHPSNIKINRGLLQEIRTYISKSQRILFYYSELFSKFEGDLVETGITNRYFLQGLMKNLLERDYILSGDYISKKEGWTIEDEIDKYMFDRKYVDKEELANEFKGLNKMILINSIKKNPKILSKEDGSYYHLLDFSIGQSDKEFLFETIENETRKAPISSKRIYIFLKNNFNMFLIRHNIGSHNELFDILNFVFAKDFSFVRPFINKAYTCDISLINEVREILADYDLISIEEARKLLKKNSIVYVSFAKLLIHLKDDFVQVSESHIGRLDETLIDDNAKEEILARIYHFLDDRDYFVARTIGDYRGFPKIGYEWNPYLLRSIVRKYFSIEIGLVDIISVSVDKMNMVFVGPKYLGMSYSEFLEALIKSKTFNSSKQVRDWIRQENLDIQM